MFKKLFVASAILVTSSSVAFADTTSGPYVGMGLGATNLHMQAKSSVPGAHASAHMSKMSADAFVGYGALVSPKIYLGGELNVASPLSYGISLLPGALIADHTMAFARLGVNRMPMSVTVTEPGQTASTHKTVIGTQLGLGLQTSLTENVDVRGEVDHTFYRSFRVLDERISTNTNQLKVSLLYKFD